MEDDRIERRVSSVALYLQHVEATRGRAERDWLLSQVDGFWDLHEDEYECVDNVRLADDGDELERQAYGAAVDGGCCGGHDREFGGSPAGRTYLYGFNYGH
jgi:hypothetical protein